MTRVNTNIGALNALKSLSDVNNRLSIAQLRLATGKRINSAADDAAGYSIAKKFNVRSEGLGQAINNIGSARNLVSIAEGHLNNIVDVLTQMKTKATQAADDSLGTSERNASKAELFSLGKQMKLEVAQATWNGKDLFQGNASNTSSNAALNFQIGAGNTQNDILKFDLLNTSNVKFSTDNNGFAPLQLNLTPSTKSIAPVSRIDTSKSFANAGFANTPNGTTNINGTTFTLSNYTTVQDFMEDINDDGILLNKGFAYAGFGNTPIGTVTINGWTSANLATYASVNAFINDVSTNANITISYNSTIDKFTIRPNTAGTDLNISQSDPTNGFFALSNISTGTYKVKATSTSAVTAWGADTTKPFTSAAGFPITPDGKITINGQDFILSNYSTVQAFMNAINSDATANATISYDSAADKFTITNNSTTASMVISETPNTSGRGFFTQAKMTVGTYQPSASVSSTEVVTGAGVIDATKSFANAGFTNVPDGKITINGQDFILSNYSTVQAFMNAINSDATANATISYDSAADKFTITNNSTTASMVISETPNTSGMGFFTQAKMTVGTYPPSASVSTTEVVTGAGVIDVTKSFASAAGFTNTPDGTVTINGWTSANLSTYASVDAFMNAAGTNANVSFGYDSVTDKFIIYPNTAGTDLVISQIGTFGFFSETKITPGTYSHITGSASQVGVDTNATLSYDLTADKFTITHKISGANLSLLQTGTGFFTEAKIDLSGLPAHSLTSTSKIRPSLDISKVFASAGFINVPDGTVTINGKIFDLVNYSPPKTVQNFMDDINNDAEANTYISYDSSTDKFTIRQKDVAIDLVISESPATAGRGFFTQTKITVGTYNDPGVSSSAVAQNLMGKIDNAIADVSSALSYIGSVVNRLTYQENSLTTAKTNTDAAKSRIEDADMAYEQLQSTKLQIIQQTASAMLAQANTSPQTIMSLFK